MRFMLSRRWAMFAVVVVVLAYGCYLLGRWQFHRLHERETSNTQIRKNLSAPAAPVGQVLRPGRPAPADAEWRRVDATGTYLDDETVVIRYQTRQGAAGIDVVTPLRTSAGPLLLVDRGWMKTDDIGSDTIRTPAAPSGAVHVVGWARADGTGSATTVTDRSARAISSTAIGRTLDAPVYGGFVDLERETPRPATPLVKAEMPDLGNGPHFFYGLQWWFFGLLAVFGFFYLAYDERKHPDRRRVGPRAADGPPDPEPSGSQRPEHPPVDREHHTADEARSG